MSETGRGDKRPDLYSIFKPKTHPQKRKAEASTEPAKRRKPRSLSDLLDEFPIEVLKSEGVDVEVIRESSDELLCSFFRTLSNKDEEAQVAICGGFAYFPAYNLSVQCSEPNMFRLNCVVPHGVSAITDLLKATQHNPKTVDCVLLQFELLSGESGTEASVKPSSADEALQPFHLYRMFQNQTARLKQEGLQLSYELLRNSQEAVVKCELAGIHFDTEAHRGLMAVWHSQSQNSETELRAELGEINFNSTKQLSEALANYIKKKRLEGLLDKWPVSQTGQLKTDSATLKFHADDPELEKVVSNLLEYRTATKLLSSFGHSLNSYVINSRIHTKFKLNGAVTGRLSSSEPNLQNIPHSVEFRKLFTAPPGREIVVGDYSQIELRVVALLAHDTDMIGVFDRNQDMHQYTAASILNVPEDSVSNEQRRLAKAVNFGLLYGQGANSFSRYAQSNFDVKLSLSEAKAYISKFYRTFPGLKVWQESLKNAKVVNTPLGRKRRTSIPMEKQNTTIQGGAAEVMLKLLGKLRVMLHEHDCVLVNVVHDEVILEVAEAEAGTCCRKLKRLMQEAWNEFTQEAQFGSVNWDVAKVASGPDWGQCKETLS
mmetsp:Transcript_21138/g.39044  ORF Transcript_21138/g.39044 Transcript_21138/m.39044 type:complete len:600 (+) Transcript_21138:372-2171(+)|eukprot:CAMPEP_0204912852 /NCGR_PEP_ID=MMETSP1397-20131031/10931_1 /ASSEMBLY_ACC=CAM_ASM_000891 /TAXON_ID=49980 /ORGANISM="Climacostomum Climacostomum virens, Strain Stock W-24" /LENGTH=599 /DNA_ID=CAMNT_0052083965 /DNA_START=307 /DNA_END=2106 /DNA_ORIENTATION=-